MPQNEPTWFAINRTGEQDEAEVSIYDAIGAYGVTADHFVNALKGISAKRITLRLNTPGGEVFDGTAIHNAIIEHPAHVTVHVDGVAASAGSFIAMAGDEIRMADNTYMMIHNARGGVMGEAEDMHRYADLLDKMNDVIAGMYERKTGKPRRHWRNLMDNETWFTAAEAKAEGLADVVEPATKKAAAVKATRSQFNFAAYNKIPDDVRRLWGLANDTSAAPPVATPATDTPPGIEPTNAPEVSPSGDHAALTQETSTMSDTASPAAPAPAAVTAPVPTVIDSAEAHRIKMEQIKGATAEAAYTRGHTDGFNEGGIAGFEKSMSNLKAILAACCGDEKMAVDAFTRNQTPEAVKLAYDAANAVRVAANLREQEQALKIARLEQLAATGGHPGVNTGFATSSDEGDDTVMDAARATAQAEREWDTQPAVRRTAKSKEVYVLARTAELDGTHRTFAR
jgi:ATP-dependent protease ClpP protease subunit